jgi:hypothetical protein
MFTEIQESELCELNAGGIIYDIFFQVGRGVAFVCEVVRENYEQGNQLYFGY